MGLILSRHYPARGRKPNPCFCAQSRKKLLAFTPLPRKGTETFGIARSLPLLLPSFTPLPRKGTETVLDRLVSSTITFFLSRHYPARGRKLCVLMGLPRPQISFTPLPRKGTETELVTRTVTIAGSLNFHAITPQGDGNKVGGL